MKRKFLSRMILVLVGLLALLGLRKIFQLEYAGGGQYGKGSSLRADEYGSMILYETLVELSDIKVKQNARPLDKFLPELESAQTLLMMLNTPLYLINAHEDLEAFVKAGGRVIITPPQRFDSMLEPVLLEMAPDQEDSDKESIDWGLMDLDYKNETGEAVNVQRLAGVTEGPETITWELSQTFSTHEGWESLYQFEDQPVILRKHLGEGEILLLADAALLSNRAMYRLRQPEALSWLLGNARTVVFEEAHLGKNQPKGLAALMWRYRMQYIVAAIAFPFVLLLWQSVVPLLPTLPPEEELSRGPQGRLSGFRDLLLRHIPSKEIHRHCLEAWQESERIGNPHKKTQDPRLQEAKVFIASPKRQSENTLSQIYQHLHQLLTQKRTKL